MYKLLYPFGAILIAVIVLSSFSYQLPSVSDVVVVSNEKEDLALVEEPVNWESVLKTVPNYFKDPEKENLEKATVQEVRRLPNEAQLVAIINSDGAGRTAGVFIVPGLQEPQAIELGDTWLPPWKLKNISADSVTWLNTNDDAEIYQKLF